MASVYYKNRTEAGYKAAQELLKNGTTSNSTVISLTTDAAMVAVQLATALRCPLQLFLSKEVKVPGNFIVGSTNQEGTFGYRTDMGAGFDDYFYQEFRTYIEQGTRESFSQINQELSGKTVFRKDLMAKRDIYVVIDCLESVAPLDSFFESIKTVVFNKMVFCAPIAMSETMGHIQQKSDRYFVDGVIDFFFGVDHYFEDNSVIPREEVIDKISSSLKLWP